MTNVQTASAAASPDAPIPSRPPGRAGGTPDPHEARLLAGSLRSGAVTALLGGRAAARTRLLNEGVMTLLARRAGDRRPPWWQDLAREPHAQPRPGQPERSAQSNESVLYFDAALPASLANWKLELEALAADPRPARHKLVLLGTDAQDEPAPDWPPLCDALLRGLQARPPKWQVLLAAADEHSQPYALWSTLLPGLGDNALRLDTGAPVRTGARTPTLAVPAKTAAEPATPSSSLSAAMSASMSASQSSSPAHPPIPAPLSTPTPTPTPSPTPAPTAVTMLRSAQAASLRRAQRPTVQQRRQRVLGVLAVGLMATGLVQLLGYAPGQRPAAAVAPLVAHLAPPVQPMQPTPQAVAERPAAPVPTASTEPGTELLAALRPLPLTDLRQGPDAAAGAVHAATTARLAVLRHDTLQTLQRRAQAGDLLLVTPLFIEPVLAWVRADAPWRDWQDLSGRRWAASAANSSSADTTARLQRALSGGAGAAASPSQPGARPLPGSAVLAGQADAWLSVGWLEPAAIPPGLRALPVREAAAGTRHIWQDYLPLSLSRSVPAGRSATTAATEGRTPGVMSFLAVYGGTRAEREELARQALRELCAALPQLQAQGHAAWKGSAVGSLLPAALPYAHAAEDAEGRCEPLAATTNPGRSPTRLADSGMTNPGKDR